MIINVERTRPLYARAVDLVATVVAWILFVILLYRGVLDAGTDPVSGPRPIAPDLLSTFDTLSLYLVVALINAAILIGWALYNQFRFRGQDRRRPIAVLADHELAKRFRVKADALEELRANRSVVVYHNEHGDIFALRRRTLKASHAPVPLAPTT